MKKILLLFNNKKNAMLAEYPKHTELTLWVFDTLSDMVQQDFGAISPIGKRYRFVFDCVEDVLKKMYAEDVRKKYAMDVLDTLLDDLVVHYMQRTMHDTAGEYSVRLSNAKGELRTSQWSDESSHHWYRAIGCLE